MQHITLLISVSDAFEDGNYLRIANALLNRGERVTLCFMDSMAMRHSEIIAMGFDLKSPMSPGDDFPQTRQVKLAECESVWVLTLGMRHSFLDKMQLLYCLQGHCRIINSLDALMHLKSKYFLASHPDVFQYPATTVSTRPDLLLKEIETGGKWIAKPPAGSLGRDIYLLDHADSNTRVILEAMTGPDEDRYCLLQPYVEEIQQGEKRVLFAGGQVVGQYMRNATSDHRTNIQTGASASLCELSEEEQSYCKKIGSFLKQMGADFVGLDLAFPWVIEFNVVNPGGLVTISELGGEDLTPAIIERIFPISA